MVAIGLAVWVGLASPAGGGQTDGCDVAIVLSAYRPYEGIAEALRGVLEKAGRRCVVVKFGEGQAGKATSDEEPATTAPAENAEAISEVRRAGEELTRARPRVVVSVGMGATTLALKAVPDVPTVFCMIPNMMDRPFVAGDAPQRARLAGVATDIAPSDHIRWIKKVSPAVKTLAIPCGDRSRRTAEEIAAAGRKEGITVITIATQNGRFADAIQEIDRKGCDGVLMLPDADVYNSVNVQGLLLWGLRSRKPVWTFSANVVRAGALAGLYFDPESIPKQTAALVGRLLGGEPVKALGLNYPERVLAAVNERTAEMIGVSLKREVLESLHARYGRQQP